MENPAEDVLRFIEEQIDTVPHIEALLLLWESRPRAFTAAELAQRIFVTEAAAARLLKDLQKRRFVTETEPHYAYDPGWDAAGDFMPRIAATYRGHLIRVTRLIHAKASPGVLEFARAFEPKKE